LSYPAIGALGILIMGYGDGMAALIGKRYGKRKFMILGSEKSLEGSLTMFIVSFFTTYIVLSFSPVPGILIYSILIAFFASIVEAITPHGFDNLTVPLGTSLFFWLLIRLI
jgi:phytol kinase